MSKKFNIAQRISSPIADVMQNSIEHGDHPELLQPFNNALTANPNFKNYLNNMDMAEAIKLEKELDKLNTTQDIKAFDTVLNQIAKDPNFNFNRFNSANVAQTIQAIKAAPQQAATPVPPVASAPPPQPAPSTPPAPSAVHDASTANIGSAALKFATALDLDPKLKTAFQNATKYNPKFAAYIDAKMEDTGSGLLSKLTDKLLKTDTKGNPFIDTQVSEPLRGILNTIANDPNYDLKNLDGLGDALDKHTKAQHKSNVLAQTLKDNKNPALTSKISEDIEKANATEKTAQNHLVDSIRKAGGTVSPFAKADGHIIKSFFQEAFGPNGVKNAVSNLVDRLGLSGGQGAEFGGSMRFLGNLMESFFGRFAKLGPHFSNMISAGTQFATNLTGAPQAEFNGPSVATASATPTASAPIKTASVTPLEKPTGYDQSGRQVDPKKEPTKVASLSHDSFERAAKGQEAPADTSVALTNAPTFSAAPPAVA